MHSLPQSGVKRKVIPCDAYVKVRDQIKDTTNTTNRSGTMMLFTLSMDDTDLVNETLLINKVIKWRRTGMYS